MFSEFCPRDGGRFEGETCGIRGDFIFSSFDGFVAVLTDCTAFNLITYRLSWLLLKLNWQQARLL